MNISIPLTIGGIFGYIIYKSFNQRTGIPYLTSSNAFLTVGDRKHILFSKQSYYMGKKITIRPNQPNTEWGDVDIDGFFIQNVYLKKFLEHIGPYASDVTFI